MNDVVGRLFEHHRMAVMGIVNVTPDSFSDGGQFSSADAAVEHAVAQADWGAQIVDVGGESTRPGSEGVDTETELGRVVPVIEGIREERPEVLVSVDTSKPGVAKAAIAAGAEVVNDVSAGGDPSMFDLVAQSGATLVLMHMRGQPRTMQKDTSYDDVVEEVRDFLVERAEAATAAGVAREKILVDPGIGFGKSLKGNLALIKGLPRLADAGYPVVLGTSRKSFLGLITDAPVDERVGGTLASMVPSLELERVVVRVHDVLEVVRFRAVLEALEGAA